MVGAIKTKFLEKVLDELLSEERTIRDPVHGDILVNRLETAIIDTEIFQRLRRIRQLGTVHLVFPGAEHSRIQHSIGTLFVACTLLNNVSESSPEYRMLCEERPAKEKAFKLVIRLSALLHDLYEFPFSHTLEKEGHILESQWKDPKLNVRFFGQESELFLVVTSFIKENLEMNSFYQSTLTEEASEEFVRNLAGTIFTYIYIILTETKGKPKNVFKRLNTDGNLIGDFLDEDYLKAGRHLVMNTVCADLLDYLARDFYFCGIDKIYDKRFMKYATFVNVATPKAVNKKMEFGYSLIANGDDIEPSVLSSLFNVLELRYSLAEEVHTNSVKNAYSAMVIEAFNAYYQTLNEDEQNRFKERMMKMGDDELLVYLRQKSRESRQGKQDSTSKYILDNYFRHKNYREFVLWENWDDAIERSLTEEGLEYLKKGDTRYNLQRILIKMINEDLPSEKRLHDGDLLIYVIPDPSVMYKGLETNVVFSGDDKKQTVITLEKLSDKLKDTLTPMTPMMKFVVQRVSMERDLLMVKFKNLWRISLFISSDVDLEDTDYKSIPSLCSDLIEKIFGLRGINVRPMITGPTVLPENINNILVSINATDADRRSWTMDDLLNFLIDELSPDE